MRVTVEKSRRLLTVTENGRALWQTRVALGREPAGPKRREGDGRTPEGVYRVCLCKAQGKYGLSLGLSYPGAADARRAYAEGIIDRATLDAVEAAETEGRRPPWGTPLGGEIYIHGGGTQTDWTAGCIALSDSDMAVLFKAADLGMPVVILP